MSESGIAPKNGGPIVWMLLGALAVVSAGLVYMLLRPDPAPAPAPPAAESAARAQPAAPAARFTRAATTADPNGFANIRGGPSVEHPLVGRVEQGDTFTTYPQTGQFWEVRAADGTIGYMASDYIRMMGNGAAAPAPAATAPQAVAAIPPDAVPPVAVPARRGFSRAGMIFPDSDRRLLGPSDVARLSLSELRVARNEIYARRGRAFADPALRRYFGQFDWYQPVAAEVALSRVESANVAFLQASEAGK